MDVINSIQQLPPYARVTLGFGLLPSLAIRLARSVRWSVVEEAMAIKEAYSRTMGALTDEDPETLTGEQEEELRSSRPTGDLVEAIKNIGDEKEFADKMRVDQGFYAKLPAIEHSRLLQSFVNQLYDACTMGAEEREKDLIKERSSFKHGWNWLESEKPDLSKRNIQRLMDLHDEDDEGIIKASIIENHSRAIRRRKLDAQRAKELFEVAVADWDQEDAWYKLPLRDRKAILDKILEVRPKFSGEGEDSLITRMHAKRLAGYQSAEDTVGDKRLINSFRDACVQYRKQVIRELEHEEPALS